MVRRPRPDKRDVFIGNFEPYGFYDIHDETADETLRVWTEDSLTRESYLGGLAHLYQHRGAEAATDFQKLLDHRGLVLNYHYGALANLALARAYALQGETAKARANTKISSLSGKTPTPTSPS